jgi:YaiO family outer membrane protein
MGKLRYLGAVFVTALAPAVLSAETFTEDPDRHRSPSTEVEAGAGIDLLTNDLPDWRRLYVEGVRRLDPGVVYGGVQAADRFDLADTEAHIGSYVPLAPKTTGVVEATVGATHDIFPKWSLFGQVEQVLPAGWGVHLGYRHREYVASTLKIGIVTLERYWGSYRGAYSWSLIDLEGDRESNHRFQLTRYYGERSSIGFVYTDGRERELTFAGTTVIFDVRSYTFVGRHWFNDRWAVSYVAGITEQGDAYKRRGMSLGIRRLF